MTNATQYTAAAASEHIAPAPRVSVQAFCETVETAAAIQAAGEDRRLSKVHLKVQMGGITAAVEAYSNAPTANVIIIESEARDAELIAGLDSLAEVCDAGTRVLVIGRYNDVVLYRELLRRGISDYLISPVGAFDLVRSICGLYCAPDAKPIGRIVASAPKAGLAPLPSRITWPGRSRATCSSTSRSPTSTSPSGPPVSISIRILRRALPMQCSPQTGSTPHSLTGCCRNAPIS